MSNPNPVNFSILDKYCVTIRCVPEAGCEQSKAPEGEPCFNQYSVHANNEQEAIEHAFRRHVCHCTGQPGMCEVSAEAARVAEELVD